MLVEEHELVLDFLSIRNIENDTLKFQYFIMLAIQALSGLPYPAPLPVSLDDFILIGERLVQRQHPRPLRSDSLLIRRYDQVIEADITIMQETLIFIPGQGFAPIGDIEHRPVMVILGPVGKAGQMGKQHRFAALAFCKPLFRFLPL